MPDARFTFSIPDKDRALTEALEGMRDRSNFIRRALKAALAGEVEFPETTDEAIHHMRRQLDALTKMVQGMQGQILVSRSVDGEQNVQAEREIAEQFLDDIEIDLDIE